MGPRRKIAPGPRGGGVAWAPAESVGPEGARAPAPGRVGPRRENHVNCEEICVGYPEKS